MIFPRGSSRRELILAVADGSDALRSLFAEFLGRTAIMRPCVHDHAGALEELYRLALAVN